MTLFDRVLTAFMNDAFRVQPNVDHVGSPHAPTQSDAVSRDPSSWKKDDATNPAVEGLMRCEHFEILRREDGSAWQLGSGAMGTTYKATDTRLHCLVALKILRPELLSRTPVARMRFLREARTAASVHHPNVASVFHLGELPDGQCFYAMEFIEGETLGERVGRNGPLSVLLALEITLQVTRALAAAARLDLIHRDIKPANLMLTVAGMNACDMFFPERTTTPWQSGGAENVSLIKLIDFGLARSVKGQGGESLTVAGDFVGTPAFASPEQVSEDEVSIDCRSDIFSLGVTLWFMLTGQQPFAGRTFEETQRLRLRARPLKHLRQAAVPEPVITLLRTMLATDPAHRPQTPTALVEAIVRCRYEVTSRLVRSHSGSGDGQPCLVPFSRKLNWQEVSLAVSLLLLLFLGATAAWMSRFQAEKFVSTAPSDHPSLGDAIIPENSIAVLPFENLSRDPDNVFFTEGIQDEILTDLAKASSLKVISRTSVRQYGSGQSRDLRTVSALGTLHPPANRRRSRIAGRHRDR